MSGRSYQQRRMDSMALALAKQLSRRYPNGPREAQQDSQYEAVVTQWLALLLEESGLILTSSSQSSRNSIADAVNNGNTLEEAASTEYQEIQTVLSMAIAQWKSHQSVDSTETFSNDDNNNTIKNKEPVATQKSFSWLDQLQGASLLYNFVSMDDIVEASSDQERLIVLLQKVSHVDDILLDWNRVSPLVRQGLILHDTMEDDDKEGVNNEAPNMAMEYLQLHRTWFDQGRSSTEHVGLQYDLCRNVMVAIQERMVTLLTLPTTTATTTTATTSAIPTAAISRSTQKKWDQDSLLMHLVQTWHDMWLDIMQRGLYSEDSAQDMEITMFLWMRGNIDSAPDDDVDVDMSTLATPLSCPFPFPSHVILALVDSQSLWLHSWTNLVPIRRLVDLLEQTCVLPSLIVRAANPPRMTSTTTTTNNNVALCHARYLHSVSILRAVLVRTRVSHFPWHLVVLPQPSESEVLSSVLPITDLVDTASRIGAEIKAKDNANDLAIHSSSTTSLLSTPTSTQLLELLDIFFTALEFITTKPTTTTTTTTTSTTRKYNGGDCNNNDTVDWWIELCCDAMDALLWGCKRHYQDFDMVPLQARLSSIHDKMTVGSPMIISAFCQSLDTIC